METPVLMSETSETVLNYVNELIIKMLLTW